MPGISPLTMAVNDKLSSGVEDDRDRSTEKLCGRPCGPRVLREQLRHA
jgi:hypothetical protein